MSGSGDMVCNRYAQRGIIAAVLPDSDIPYMGTLEEANDFIAVLHKKLQSAQTEIDQLELGKYDSQKCCASLHVSWKEEKSLRREQETRLEAADSLTGHFREEIGILQRAIEILRVNHEQALKVDATLIQAQLTKTSEKKEQYRKAMDKMVHLYPSIRQDLVNLRESVHREHCDDYVIMVDKILRDVDMLGGAIL